MIFDFRVMQSWAAVVSSVVSVGAALVSVIFYFRSRSARKEAGRLHHQAALQRFYEFASNSPRREEILKIFFNGEPPDEAAIDNDLRVGVLYLMEFVQNIALAAHRGELVDASHGADFAMEIKRRIGRVPIVLDVLQKEYYSPVFLRLYYPELVDA